jgi:4a-hydroxytetrahydrobiopterin dehydratase
MPSRENRTIRLEADKSSMSSLAEKHCVPCRGGVPPLKGADLLPYAEQLPDWKIIDEHHIAKSFLFPDFKTGLDFVNQVGAVAEQEGHHPDLCLAWGKVGVEIYTHKIRGLTESDFVMAAKIDQVYFADPRPGRDGGAATPPTAAR